MKLRDAVLLFLLTTLLATTLLSQTGRLAELGAANRTANLGAPFLDPSWSFRYWQQGRLITVRTRADNGIAAAVFDESGAIERETRITESANISLSVVAAALTPDQTLVLGAGAIDGEGRVANFLAVAGRTGRVERLNRVNPFVPLQMCSLEDGFVWAYGWERSSQKWDMEAQSYPILREFNLDGQQKRSFVDRASITGKPKARYYGDLALRCSGNRVWLFVGSIGQLFVMDATTSKLSALQLPILPRETRITGFEVLPSGEVFATMVQERGKGNWITMLFRLETTGTGTTGKWVPFGSNPVLGAGDVRLLGADGNELILLKAPEFSASWRRLR